MKYPKWYIDIINKRLEEHKKSKCITCKHFSRGSNDRIFCMHANAFDIPDEVYHVGCELYLPTDVEQAEVQAYTDLLENLSKEVILPE